MPDPARNLLTDSRIAQAVSWLQSLGIEDPKPEPVSGDASARRYFRVQVDRQCRLLMDSPPDREPLDPFLQVTEILHRAQLPAPEIVAAYPESGFLLIEDFGDCQLRDVLNRDSVGDWWPMVFDLLSRLASDPDPDALPDYSDRLLREELSLFPDWYLARHCNRPLSTDETATWARLCDLLVESALDQPQTFVHRDFHSCNLMVNPDHRLGLIDYQDAVRGPVSYDLVSILLDRYISWPRDLLEGWMLLMRRQLAPQIAPAEWVRMCDWMGLQRNLKIVGIFARLGHRDGKSGYISMIPRFSEYILDVSARYRELSDSHELLKELLCTP